MMKILEEEQYLKKYIRKRNDYPIKPLVLGVFIAMTGSCKHLLSALSFHKKMASPA